MKKIAYLISCLMVLIFASCSDNSYLNAIPNESTALISMDPAKMSGVNNMAVLKTLLHLTNIDKSGIDASHKIYLFESPDGNLGVCAKVNDENDLTETFNKLAAKGACPKPKERRGFHFTVLKDAWIAGWSDASVLIMGPVTPDAQPQLQQQMAKYLKQGEEDGITTSKIYEKLDSIDSPMAMVAQAQALPEQFIAPFTLGAPKGADASQVMIAAEMSVKKGIMHINGETFSFNKTIDKSLKDATKIYRPIKGKYINSMPKNAMLGMFLNVNGNKFLPLMHSNKGIQQLLMGVNAAIDMDNIIRSVNGEMAIITPTYGSDNISMSMTAQLENCKWTNDVGYWKQSCPAGGKILDWQKNAWYYTDNKTAFYFGVSKDMQFFSGSSKEEAAQSIMDSKEQLGDNVKDIIKGQKLVMVINMNAMKGDKAGAVTSMMKPIFGNLETIVYTLK